MAGGLADAVRHVGGARDVEGVRARTAEALAELLGAEAAAGGGGTRVDVTPAGAEPWFVGVERAAPLTADELDACAVVAEAAARAEEHARLQAEARLRDGERSRLADQLLTAEQDERRRLALFLHDTSVQSLSAIAMMLDAATHSVSSGRRDEATTVLGSALSRLRTTIGALRDLSFELEPVVLRDQGFVPAVAALAEQLGLAEELRVEVDAEAGETLGPKAQAALYQIIREALHGAIRRGPPTWIAVRVAGGEAGVEAVIADDAPGERRRSTLDAIAERARTLSGSLDVEQGDDGTTLRVRLPAYAARG